MLLAMEAPAALLILLVLPSAFGGPVSWYSYGDGPTDRCATHCTGTSKFQYTVDSVYQYDYDVTTTTTMQGAGDGVALTNIKARVNIHVLSKCEMALSLVDVRFKSSEPGSSDLKDVDNWQFAMDLERNVLRFAFQDGKVEDLCPSDEDSVQSINFKRGILSVFQNSMNQHEREESLREIDVTGKCPTQYSVPQKGWKTVQFTKDKDLLGCSDRHSYKSVMKSTPFSLPDSIQSLPLLKGSHKCGQTVSSDGYIQAAFCEETLVFRPFSKREAGASTKTVQKLSHVYTTRNSPVRQGIVSRRTNLFYEHSSKAVSSDQTLWSAREKLSELCRQTVQGIPATAPGLFTDLVYLMRGLDSQEILDIAERVQRGNICQENRNKARKFFMDSLPMIGTAASVEVMVDMLLAGDVKETEQELWITSFNFIHEPNLETVSNLRRLLLSDSMRQMSLLPVTSVINNYCRMNTECASTRQISDVLSVLEGILGRDCGDADGDLVLLALRAVGNLGHSDAISFTLEKCMESNRNPTIIRVTAAQAYRAVSCGANRKALMDTFMNADEDSELRINAYLSVMMCPNEIVLSEVRKALEKEQVNQVGSFVWTHLTNLMSSSSPYKQDIREILEDEKLQTEFDMDRRKYSRNYELSYFSEKFGLGGAMESNVIFSSKSFLPRSLMLNLTVDMLGHSVNLMEAGARVQGLETLLKNYLGPGGLFSKQGNDKSVSRCVREEKMDKMNKKFSVSEDEMSASFYLKMFGNEMTFQHFNEKELEDLKDKLNVKRILTTLARGDDVSFTRSALFLDSSVTVPTIAGMGLTLSVNGSATIELIAKGKMDIRHISQKRMQALLDVQPSAAVELSGLMSLDSGASTAGLKMKTTLHTSTAAIGSVELVNGQLLTMEFDTPREKMEILDVKSEFFLLHNKQVEKQDMKKNGELKKAACPQLTLLKGLGYELCASVAYTKPSSTQISPNFPFTGPVSLSVTLDKKDAPKGFRIVGKYIKNDETAVGQLSFDAPGSKSNRAINVGYFLDMKAQSAEIELNSPWKKMLAKGAYNNDPDNRKLSATILNDNQEYKMTVKLATNTTKSEIVWRPSLELTRPENSELLRETPVRFTVDGFLSIDKKYQDMSAELNINSGLKPDPIQLKANYINKKRQKTIFGSATLNNKQTYSGTFQVLADISDKKTVIGKIEPTILISTPDRRLFLLSGSMDFKEEKLLKGSMQVIMEKTLKKPIELSWKFTKSPRKNLDRIRVMAKLVSEFITAKSKGSVNVPAIGSALKKGNLLIGKIVTDYTIPRVGKNSITVASKIFDRSAKSLRKYDIELNVDNKKDPENSYAISGELEHKTAYTKSLLTIRPGPKAKFSKDRSKDISVGLSLTHKLNDKMALIQYSGQFVYPPKNLEYQVAGKHEHHLPKFWFETYTSVIFGEKKSVEFRVNGKDNSQKRDLNAVGNLEIHFSDLEIGQTKIAANSYKISTSIEQTPEKEYIHTASVQTEANVKHSMVTTVKMDKDVLTGVRSEVQIRGESPASLTVDMQNDAKKSKGSLDFRHEGKEFRGEFTREAINATYQSMTWDLSVPEITVGDLNLTERRVKVFIEGGITSKTSSAFKFETKWDANRDPSQAVNIDMFYVLGNSQQNGGKYEYDMKVTTPFKDHEIYRYRRYTEMSDKKVKDELVLVTGQQDSELSYSFYFLLPLSSERIEMGIFIVTPYQKLRKLDVEIIHKLDGSKYLSTKVMTKCNREFMDIAIIYRNAGDLVRQDVTLTTTLTSSIQKMTKVFLNIAHNDDGTTFTTQTNFELEDSRYSANLNTKFIKVHYQIQMDSTLDITLPNDRPLTIRVTHSNSLTNLNSEVSLSWKPEADMKLIIGAMRNEAEKHCEYSIEFSGPFERLQHIKTTHTYKNTFGVVTSRIWTQINKDSDATILNTFKYSDQELDITFYKGSDNFNLNAKYAAFPYTLYSKTEMKDEKQPWKMNSAVLEASVDENEFNGYSTVAKLTTTFEGERNVELRADLENKVDEEYTLNTVVSMGVRQIITANFLVDTKNFKKFNGNIRTPYEEMSNFNFGYDRTDSESEMKQNGYIEMKPIFNKITLTKALTYSSDMEAKFHLELPDTEFKYIDIDVSHNKLRRGIRTLATVKYHPDQKIDMAFKSLFSSKKFPDNTKVFLDLSTPFAELPSLNVAASLDKNLDKWIGDLDLKTGAKELEYMTVKLTHSSSETFCHNDIYVSSSVFETVTTGIHADFGDLKGMNLSLNAPSVGYTNIGFKHKSNSWLDFQNKIFFDINGKDLDMDVAVKHNENDTEVSLSYVYPDADQSYVKASVHKLGNSVRDFDVGGFLKVGRYSRPYNVSMQFSGIPTKHALGTTLETPYTKSLSYLVKNEQTPSGVINTVLYGKYGKRFLLDSVTRQKYNANEILYHMESTMKMDENVTRTVTNFELDLKDSGEDMLYEHQYNDHWLKSRMSRNSVKEGDSDKHTVNVEVFTSYDKFSDIGAEMYVNSRADRHEGAVNLEYMDDKKAVLTFDLSKEGRDKLSLKSELNLPIQGYEKNTLTYNQVMNPRECKADAQVNTKQGNLYGTMTFTNKKDFNLSLRGPLETFESLSITAKYDERAIKVNGESSLKLTLNPRPVKLEFDIDVNDVMPLSMSYKLRSPYDNIRKVDLKVTHTGNDWKRFATSSAMSSDAIGDINAGMEWKFEDVYNMEGKATVVSNIRNVEDLKASIKTERKSEDSPVSSSVEVGWARDKEIKLAHVWKLREGRRTKLESELDVTTPFDNLRTGGFKILHAHSDKELSESLDLYRNGEHYIDADLNYQFAKGIHGATLDVNKPRPMYFDVQGTSRDGGISGSAKLNWDKLKKDHQFDISTSYLDSSDEMKTSRAFNFWVSHPVRSMGVDGSYQRGSGYLLTNGQLSWDKTRGKTILYDLGLKNMESGQEKSYDGHLKLGVPQRSVKMQGSAKYSDDSITTNSALLWDADKDERKKVEVTTSMEDRYNEKKVDFKVNLPSINREMEIAMTNKKPSGGLMWDSKTEISYSPNPLKTITLTSKLFNPLFGSADFYNYTAEIGISHPVTDTNIQSISHVGRKDQKRSAGTLMTFMDTNRDTKNIQMLASVDDARNYMEILVATPVKTVRVEGELEDSEKRQQATWRSYEDGKRGMRADLVVDRFRRTLDLEFNYDEENPEKMVSLSGRLVNDSALQVDILSYESRNQPVTESMMAVRLNSSNVLHTRIQWRPTLFNDLQGYMGTKVTDFSYRSNALLNDVVKSIGTEVQAKYELISREMRSELDDLLELMQKEMYSFREQLEELRTQLRRAYQRNDLRIRDMGDQAQAAIEEILNKMAELSRQSQAYYLSLSKATTESIESLKSYPIAQYYQATIADMSANLKEMREMMEEALNEVVVQAEELSRLSYKYYLEMSRSIDRKLNSYSYAKHQLPMYREMVRQREELAKIGENVIPNWAHAMDKAYIMGQDVLMSQFDDMMKRPEFRYLHSMSTEVHQQFMYYSKEGGFTTGVKQLVELSKNLIMMELAKLTNSFTDLQKSRVIVYDPKRGELQLELHMPVEMRSLLEPPKFTAKKHIKKFQDYLSNSLPSTNAKVWDTVYNYVPSLEGSSLMPPFEASAYLMGSQHILTYDQHATTYLSQCSYVLARDMLHDTFSVVVNYNRNPARDGVRSLCFTFDQSTHLEVSSDYKLEVEGKDTEMPFITERVKVFREGDVIRVIYAGGVEVLCNPSISLYKVTLNGWFHGKVDGLLGTYDNEPGNDLMAERKSSSLEVGRRSCKDGNMAVASDDSYDSDNLCRQQFSDKNSKFSPCFNQVAPTSFLSMCHVYMAKTTPEEAIRLATEQYRQVCQGKGVYIGSLKDVATCSSKDAFTIDHRDPLYQSADVVFVVEDTECNSWARSSLATMVTEINKALETAGMKDNRFGLEGYGGDSDEGYTVRTINGQMFGEANLFLRAVETLSLSPSLEEPDIVTAVQKAMEYPYRVGVAKVLVLAPCSSCEVSFLNRNLAELLRVQGFNVHVLQQQEYTMGRTDMDANSYKIYGIDNSKTFTNVISDSSLTPNAVLGKKKADFCNEMARATNGSVFDTTHLADSAKRNFIKSFANRLGWDTKLPLCQECQCNTASGRMECNICQSNSLFSYPYMPWSPPSLYHALGDLHEFDYDLKNSLGL